MTFRADRCRRALALRHEAQGYIPIGRGSKRELFPIPSNRGHRGREGKHLIQVTQSKKFPSAGFDAVADHYRLG